MLWVFIRSTSASNEYHNVFYGEIRNIMPELSPNTVICAMVLVKAPYDKIFLLAHKSNVQCDLKPFFPSSFLV